MSCWRRVDLLLLVICTVFYFNIHLHFRITCTPLTGLRIIGFRKLLSQQRARNAEGATAEAEEVIRSRPGTPKLLKTVIKVRHLSTHSVITQNVPPPLCRFTDPSIIEYRYKNRLFPTACPLLFQLTAFFICSTCLLNNRKVM